MSFAACKDTVVSKQEVAAKIRDWNELYFKKVFLLVDIYFDAYVRENHRFNFRALPKQNTDARCCIGGHSFKKKRQLLNDL